MCDQRNYFGRRTIRIVPGPTRDATTERLSDLLTSIARQTHSQRVYGEMAARAGITIRPYLFTVLARIRQLQPVRITDVAEEMDNERSTVSRQVAELTALGCVERHADPTDGRVVVLTTTAFGEEIIGRVFEAWYEVLGDMLADWSAPDRTQLVELLERLDDALIDHFTPQPQAIT